MPPRSSRAHPWPAHRAHDVRELLRRWRAAVRGTGFRLIKVGEKDGFPLVMIQNGVLGDGGLYVSTGIHGDEPAPPWGLLAWFESGGYEPIKHLPVTLFPCLNPHGITENTRLDKGGRDLNRLFDRKRLSPIREIRAAIRGRRFDLGICLHEDYDAQGAYLYDLNHQGDDSSAREILCQTTSEEIPVDQRKKIDGRPSAEGVIFRKRLDLRNIPGLPEAVFLFLEGHAKRTLTFETPSEFALPARVETQRRFLEVIYQLTTPTHKEERQSK